MRRAALLATAPSLLALAASIGGCLDIPSAVPPRDASPPADASEPPRVLGVTVLDTSGRAWPPDAIPRAPRIWISVSAPLSGTPEPLMLLAGDDDAELRDDLASAPLRTTTSARVLECERTTDGARVELRPIAPLAPGASVVVAIGAWARDPEGRRVEGAWTRALRVGAGAASGAQAVETWPPDGATAIAPAMPLAGVRFDGAVSGLEDGLWIEGLDGARVPGIARAARCDEIGWEGAHCAAIVPARALAPGTPHSIRSGTALRDATGAEVPALIASFTTALAPDVEPPGWSEIACAIDEAPIEPGCALADDGRITLRVRATEPVRLRLDAAGRRVLVIAPRGEATLDIAGLAASASVPAILTATDAAGHARRIELALATTEPLAPISITEVRADPWGAEPRQEYVELENRGPDTIDLSGFALADSASSVGDVITGSHRVPPGARALVVAEGFDPEDRGDGDRDVPVPPGVALIRVDRSLASGGLSNAGEPLFLRDPMGRRISAAPAEPPPRPGVCIVRIAEDPRTGARGSFDYDAEGGCTPGR